MNIREFCKNNFKEKDFKFWRVFWLREVLNYILKNRTEHGYFLQVWNIEVLDLKRGLFNEREFLVPCLFFPAMKSYNCHERLDVVMKALSFLLLYLFGFRKDQLFSLSYAFPNERLPKSLYSLNPHLEEKKSGQILNLIYLLLVSGETSYQDKSIQELLELALTEMISEKRQIKKRGNIKPILGRRKLVFNPEKSGECLKILEGHTGFVNLAIELKNGNLAYCSADDSIKIWDLKIGECLKTFEYDRFSIHRMMIFLEDQKIACVFGNDIKIENVVTGMGGQVLEGHVKGVNEIINLEGGLLASCSDDNTIKIWDVNAVKCLKTLEGHSARVVEILNLNKGLLASASFDKTIKIWDINTGKCLMTLKRHGSGSVRMIKLEKELLASFNDNIIEIWDINTGVCLRSLEGHSGFISNLIILEEKIISGSEDGVMKVWDINTGVCLKTLEGHNVWVRSIAKLENEEIISGSEDGIMKIWDINTGVCLKTFKAHNGLVVNLKKLKDGNILSISSDGTMKIWQMVYDEVLDEDNKPNEESIALKLDWPAYLENGRVCGRDCSDVRLRFGDMVDFTCIAVNPLDNKPSEYKIIGKLMYKVKRLDDDVDFFLVDIGVDYSDKFPFRSFICREEIHDRYDFSGLPDSFFTRPGDFLIVEYLNILKVSKDQQEWEETLYWQRRYFTEERLEEYFGLSNLYHHDPDKYDYESDIELKDVEFLDSLETSKFKKGYVLADDDQSSGMFPHNVWCDERVFCNGFAFDIDPRNREEKVLAGVSLGESGETGWLYFNLRNDESSLRLWTFKDEIAYLKKEGIKFKNDACGQLDILKEDEELKWATDFLTEDRRKYLKELSKARDLLSKATLNLNAFQIANIYIRLLKYTFADFEDEKQLYREVDELRRNIEFRLNLSFESRNLSVSQKCSLAQLLVAYKGVPEVKIFLGKQIEKYI